MDRKYFKRDISKLKTTPFNIFTDQAGYLPNSEKRAVLPFECRSFEIINSDGEIKYSGETIPFGPDQASGDEVCIADFSEFTEQGIFRVRSADKLSAQFSISGSAYDSVLRDTSKAFYFLRCGCGLDKEYAGVYTHGRCHTEKAVLWDERSVSLDVSGGWHDAGDYGRYVTAGAVAAAHLLYAYKMYPDVFDKLALGIPESPLPDILSEVKYELDWMLKMQRPDGAVYHKVTTAQHAPFVMPEDDKAQLFVFDISSMATADFAAVTALASGVFRRFDPEYADDLREAALNALKWLEENPEFVGFVNPEGCNTGGYYERDADSNLYWAYAEVYDLTGDSRCHEEMKKLMDKGFPLTALGYGEVGGLGSLAYLISSRSKDEAAEAKLKKSFVDKAAELRDASDNCGYGVAMLQNEYCWGSNMNVMKNGMIYAIDNFVNGNDSRRYAERQLHYLLGTNALGISYVTGTGEFGYNYPHLRPAFADGIEECMPGMVSGGPNGRPADPFAWQVIKDGTPPMKCYADDTASYSLNEITIYWNSPTVFLLGYIVSAD